MSKVQLLNSAGANLNSGLTRYAATNGNTVFDTSEANTQTPVRYAAATVTNLTANVRSNTLSGGTGSTTVRLRVAGANGNGVVSITNGATGFFEDTTGSDSVSVGQNLNYSIVTGGASGAMSVALGCTFDSATDTAARLISVGNGVAYSLNTTTAFIGFSTLALETTAEARVATVLRGAFTARNLCLRVSANARTTTTTIRSRKNGANGNMVISVTAGSTGTFEDTTNTDSIASGDSFNYSIAGGAEVTSITLRTISCELVSTAGEFVLAATANSTGVASGATRYFPAGGLLFPFTSEASTQQRVNQAFTAKNLFVYVSSFAGSSGTARLRRNGANAGPVVTVTGTGVFEDTTNTESFADNDTVNFIYTATGGSQTVSAISIMGASSGTFAGSVAESVTAADAQSATANLGATVAESATVADAQSATASRGATAAESVTASDAESATVVRPATSAETVSASDAASATVIWSGSCAESVSPVDFQSTGTIISVTITETVAPSDAVRAGGTFGAAVGESVNPADVQRANTGFDSVNESVSPVESCVAWYGLPPVYVRSPKAATSTPTLPPVRSAGNFPTVTT